MRKHKSVVAILLAVMMIFTFMPTMAFADTPAQYSNYNAVWSSDYSSVKVTKGTTTVTYNADRTFMSNGQMKATATDADKSTDTKFATLQIAAPVAYYYDLNGAVLFKNGSEYKTRSYSRANFVYEYPKNGQSLGVSYTLGVKDPADTTAPYDYKAVNMKGYTVSFNPEKLFDYTSEDAQSISVPVVLGFNESYASSTFDPTNSSGFNEAINTDKIVTPITLNVEKAINTPAQAKFRFVGETTPIAFVGSGISETSLTYKAEPYAIEMVPAEGLTVKYQKVVDGKFVDTTDVSVENAGDKFVGRAIVSKTGAQDAYFGINLGVIANTGSAFDPSIGFNDDVDGYDSMGGYFVVSEDGKYDPMDYIKVYPGSSSNTKLAKKISSANEEALKAYFTDFYEFKKTTKAARPGFEKIEIVGKDFDDLKTAEKTALIEKHLKLFKNFGFVSTTAKATDVNFNNIDDIFVNSNLSTTYFALGTPVNTKVNEVTFTKSETIKAYKAKKKTKKLAKAKSFTVHADAESGVACTYKLVDAPAKIVINSTSGKVTCQKGLKRGTYKFYVKAIAAAGKGYARGVETHFVTVKVK